MHHYSEYTLILHGYAVNHLIPIEQVTVYGKVELNETDRFTTKSKIEWETVLSIAYSPLTDHYTVSLDSFVAVEEQIALIKDRVRSEKWLIGQVVGMTAPNQTKLPHAIVPIHFEGECQSSIPDRNNIPQTRSCLRQEILAIGAVI